MNKFLTLFTKLVPGIIALMAVAERVFSKEPKSGAQKKELVMVTVGTVINSVLDVSTGGQKETWEQLKEPVSLLIDAVATTAFPAGD